MSKKKKPNKASDPTIMPRRRFSCAGVSLPRNGKDGETKGGQGNSTEEGEGKRKQILVVSFAQLLLAGSRQGAQHKISA